MEPDGPPHRHRRRRAIWFAIGILAIVAIASLYSSALTYGNLTSGRGAMDRGKAALLTGDAALARTEFAAAEASFQRAEDAARAPWLRAVGLLPYMGRTPDAIVALGDAGLQIAHAGTVVATAAAELPDGLGSLAPSQGRLPLEAIASLERPVREAERLTGQALTMLRASAGRLVMAPVADARADALELTDALHAQLSAGGDLLEGLPGFLGADGPKRYLFGALNPAETRGGGGLLGAYAILTVDQGRFTFGRFTATQQLPPMDVATEPGSDPEYARNYAQYRVGDGFWLNANMTPDFPAAASTIADAYAAATGDHVDGVITADPFALQALLASTGPTLIPELGIRISADDVVAFVTNEAFREFRDPRVRKRVLGSVAASVLQRYLARPDPGLGALKSLAGTAGAGHIQVWSADPTFEAGLAATGVGGALDPPAGDLLAVIQNNASGTKLDFFMHRTVTYDVRLGGNGTATATLDVLLRNDAPTSGYPPYVIGPYPGLTSEAGENITIVQAYCGAGCGVTTATVDGEQAPTGLYLERGYPFLASYQRIGPGRTGHLVEHLTLPTAWEGNASGGIYRLRVEHAATIAPDELEVRITLPAGMRATELGPGLDLEGDRLVYRGSPAADLDLWVRFRPPLPLRLWRDITQPFIR